MLVNTVRRSRRGRNTTVGNIAYRGSDKLVLGIVVAVVNFCLFALTTLNIASTMRAEHGGGLLASAIADVRWAGSRCHVAGALAFWSAAIIPSFK